MAQEAVLTLKEAVERLLNQDSLENAVIKDGIYIPDCKTDYNVNIREIVCDGNLALGGAVINGQTYIGRSVIKGHLYLDGAEIKGHLILSETSVEGNLDLEGAEIKGNLYLDGIVVKGSINLAFKKGPRKIYVSPNMAELVHWSAPTIPLVIVK